MVLINILTVAYYRTELVQFKFLFLDLHTIIIMKVYEHLIILLYYRIQPEVASLEARAFIKISVPIYIFFYKPISIKYLYKHNSRKRIIIITRFELERPETYLVPGHYIKVINTADASSE